MNQNNRDIVLEILAYLSIRQLHNIKLVNKFLLDIVTKYIQNNTKKIFKKILKLKLKKTEYYSPEIIYINHYYYSSGKFLPYLWEHNDTLLILFIDNSYKYKCCINFTLARLQFISVGDMNIIFNHGLHSVKYISGNIDISNLHSLETYKYYPKYKSKYVSKYINIDTIYTDLFTQKITKINEIYPKIKKLVISITITDGFETVNNIQFSGITELIIYNIVRYCTNKQALIFKQMFPNAKIKLVDICLNKTRIF